MEHGWIFGMHISWWLFLIILIIVFVAFFEAEPRHKAKKRREQPLDILRRRYAAGELTTEEYKERKAHLEDKTPNDDSENIGH